MKKEVVDKVRERVRIRREGGPEAVGERETWSCDEIPPELFYIGLEQFNHGEYFEQHESLEEIWVMEPRSIRCLYQGILKIGVGFYKLRLGNYRGTINHISGGMAYLQRFEDGCLGVEVAQLVREAEQVRRKVVELGPERMGEFDLSTLPKVHYVRRIAEGL
ncbi:MAG: DUF309 domain-containing protein [Chloroflexi bacterium]|nr:DUF309 domain-containing protein [Chloroflexota bacterium]